MLGGLDLETSHAVSSESQLEGLMAGKLDMAITAIDNLFTWTEAGADVRLIAQVEKTTPLKVYARGSAGSLAELEGCRFGVDAPLNGFVLAARRVLRSAGVEVQYVTVGGVRERFDALVAGDVDATLLGPPFSELASAQGMQCLANLNCLLLDFPGQGLVVRAGVADSSELQEYLRALAWGVRSCGWLSSLEGRAFLSLYGFADEAASAAWDARPDTLEVSSAGLAALTDIRRSLELLPVDIELAELWDPGPLRRALDSTVP